MIRALALALLLPCTVLAQGRQMSWPAVSITAHLDSSGALTFSERQTILVSGDWNGIERDFNLRNSQSLVLRSFTRLAPASGEAFPLSEDKDLDDVDDYAWVNNGSVLRWRARLPTDPAFDNKVLEYRIDAVYDRILIPNTDGSFQLDHNFAMVDRQGPIENFELTLTLDPVWIAPADFTGRFTPGSLRPGLGFLVSIPLQYRGASRPANVRYGADESERTALFSILAAALILFLFRLVQRERELGRFAPVPDPASITAEWLEAHLFSMLPEVAGAMWDDNTSAPEVAAILARLVQEGKLTNRVETEKQFFGEKQELHLALQVERSELAAHERALIDALFSGTARTTSTSQVRERYKDAGFDPATTIRKQLDTMVGSVAPGGSKPAWKPTGLLLLAGVIAVGIGVALEPNDAFVAMPILGISIPAFLIPFLFAFGAQRALARLPLALMLLTIVLGVYIGIAAWIVLLAPLAPLAPLGIVTCVGLTLWLIALARSITNIAASRQSPERIAQRKRLYAARELFKRELRNERPALKDEWFPYLIAFGLASQADRWFKAFGGAQDASTAVLVGHAASRSSTGSSGSSWTGFGGGGGFSGGGSSASFASAIGGMAASVPSPSSSSSGGGGSSSSGGSSGGGGGGGW